MNTPDLLPDNAEIRADIAAAAIAAPPTYVLLDADPRVVALAAPLTDDQVLAVMRAAHHRWAGIDDPFTPPESAEDTRSWLIETFTLDIASGGAGEIAHFQELIALATQEWRTPAGAATPPVDLRVAPLVAALSDAQVADVLRQMNEAWSPEEDLDTLLGSPAENRRLVTDTAVLNIAMGGEAEFAELAAFAAVARAAHPAPAATQAQPL